MFDIDKLYVARYGFDENGKVITDDSDAGIKNRMLSMYLRVLRTLANTGQLKGSIDNATDNVKAILKDIEGTSVTHPAPFEVYSPTYQEARKAEYTGGKAGIGPFALNNAHHILTQLVKLKMISNPFTDAMQITDLGRIFDVPTDTDPRGQRILDWLSAMINAFVDIAKDPYIVKLNVNGWTYNMVSFLLRAGKGKQTFYFMYQPILREMAQEVLKTKGKYGVDRTKTPSQLEQEAIQRVLDKYDKDGKFQKKYRQINQDDVLSATTYSNLFKTFINDKGEESSALREMLKDPEYVGDSNEAQVMIYYAWLKLKPYADSLANLVKYSKIDTKKIGKSFAEQQNYYDGMMRMLDDPNFAEGEIRKFYDETFVGHKTENAIPFGISIFKNLLLRNTQLFTDQKNVILSLLGRRGIADSGLINAIIKGMEAQAKAQFFNDYIKSNNIDLQGMFKGQMSMAKRLNNFKQLILRRDPRMSHLIDNTGHITNDFIEFLLPNIQNTEDRPNELDFIDTSDLLNVDQAKANNLINYWRELIEDPNPQISKLFKDLVVYAFITTGDNPTMNSFFQYVPNSYRIQMGYRDFMRGQLDKFSNESTASYPDKDDFFRNNWHNDKLVKPVELTNSRGNGLLGIYYNNHMPNIVMGARLGNRGLQQAIKPINWITNVADGKKYPVFAPYVKISDSRFNRPENWHLYTLIGYKYDGDSKKYIPIYGLISKKGYKYRGHTVTEYGVQTQFDFNIEPEWNYVEAMNNPTQIADMAESAFAGMGDFWYDIKPISSLVTYQNSNYLHSMIDTVVEEDTQTDNVPLEEVDEPAEATQPTSGPQTLNIYFGTNENADLSNLAIRPFVHLGVSFQSVEQAFQFYKTEFSPKTEYNRAVGQAIKMATSGKDLRRLGRQYKDLATKEWDAMAPTIMKQLIKDSFEQNPDALQRLLSTGNAVFTHTQDRGRWGTEFPRILMEVRDELSQEQSSVNTNSNMDTGTASNQTTGFKGYVGGFSNEGKGTVQGDGKDKAMREIADGFIGELHKSPYKKVKDGYVLKDPDSSTFTSLVTIMNRGHNPGTYSDGEVYDGQVEYNLAYTKGDNGNTVMAVTNRNLYDEGWAPSVIMLARNSELKGKPLELDTKVQIKQFADKGVTFVVGDMPDVDTQFIQYLQQIGADFSIYHTGNTSRINIQNDQQNIQSMDELVTTDWNVVDFMVKEQEALETLRPVLDQMELTEEEYQSYIVEFDKILQEEHNNGNLNTKEQIEGVVNKFICNL